MKGCLESFFSHTLRTLIIASPGANHTYFSQIYSNEQKKLMRDQLWNSML